VLLQIFRRKIEETLTEEAREAEMAITAVAQGRTIEFCNVGIMGLII